MNHEQLCSKVRSRVGAGGRERMVGRKKGRQTDHKLVPVVAERLRLVLVAGHLLRNRVSKGKDGLERGGRGE